MRKLDRMEMMAIRIALEYERDKMHAFIDATPDGYSRASYRTRYERIEDLLELLKIELAKATEDDRRYFSYEWALRNAMLIEKDGSSGAHNYAYAKNLLMLSLQNFNPGGN